MNVVILAGGPNRPGLWNDYYAVIPKPIMQVFEGKSVLDYQMKALSGFNIFIVVGFQSEKVIKYCAERDYKVNFIYDKGWDKEYSSARTFLEIAPQLLAMDECIILYGDVIFEKQTLQYLIDSKADICRIRDHDEMMKFTRHGLAETIKKLSEGYIFGIQFWLSLGVKFEQTPPVTVKDLDRPENIRDMRETFKYLMSQ